MSNNKVDRLINNYLDSIQETYSEYDVWAHSGSGGSDAGTYALVASAIAAAGAGLWALYKKAKAGRSICERKCGTWSWS
jgi:hypothetical protein